MRTGTSILALAATAVALVLFPGTATAAPGGLDPSFGGGDGFTVSDFGSSETAFAVALQPDGKIVVAGQVGTGTHPFLVARYRADGTLDPGFGSGGRTTIGFPPLNLARANDVVIQPDGKILVAGYANVDGASDVGFAFARLTPAGALDPAFNGDGDSDGRVVVQPTSGYDAAYAVAVYQSGAALKIVAAGEGSGSSSKFALVRLTENGGPDPAFSGDGIIVHDLSPAKAEQANAVAVQPDGKVLAAGWLVATVGGSQYVVARYTAAGGVDAGFGGGSGRRVTDFQGGGDTARDMVLLPSGEMVLAGDVDSGGKQDFGLVKVGATGNVDSAFGEVLTDVLQSDLGYGVTAQADGKLVMVGSASDGTDQDGAVVRYRTTGALDPGFGSGGRAVVNFGTTFDSLRDVALQPDGKVVVAGYTKAVNGGPNDLLVARFFGGDPGDPGSGGPAAADATPPVVKVRLLRRKLGRVVRTRRLRARVTIDESGKVSLTARRRSRRLARKTATFSAAGSRTVVLKLSRRKARSLARRGRVRVRLRWKARDAAGNPRSGKTARTLRR